VNVGGRFCPEVTLVSETTLRVLVPQAAGAPVPGPTPVPVVVYNPDGRQVTSPQDLVYVPPLVPKPVPPQPSCALDEDFLIAVVRGAPLPCDPGLPPDAIRVIRNPSPMRDQVRDGFSATSLVASASDAYVFLFNTRRLGPAGPEPVRFAFDDVDIPPTILVDQAGLEPVRSLDPALPDLQPIPANTTIRVIIKAAGHVLNPDFSVSFDPAENFPFFLQSRQDLSIGALVHLGGDAFVTESLLETTRHRVRVDRPLPPAGAGRGGRGGAPFPEGLPALPPPNIGASSVMLTGGDGEAPVFRAPTQAPLVTGGGGTPGLTPVALQLGSGSGGGHATAGTGGLAGSTAPGPPGAGFGNATAPFGAPLPQGIPVSDEVIFGASIPDMSLLASGQAFDTGLLYGGSGGGGGAGGVTIVVPALCFGGRGGHGGGCIVMTSNRNLLLAPGGVVLAYGENGLRGVDGFPFPNGAPTIPICLPGEGGAGSGGTILGLAVAAAGRLSGRAAARRRQGGPAGSEPGVRGARAAARGRGRGRAHPLRRQRRLALPERRPGRAGGPDLLD